MRPTRKGCCSLLTILLPSLLAGCFGILPASSPQPLAPGDGALLVLGLTLGGVIPQQVGYVQGYATTYAPGGRQAVGPQLITFRLDHGQLEPFCLDRQTAVFCPYTPYITEIYLDAGYDLRIELSARIYDLSNRSRSLTWRQTVIIRGIGTQLLPEPGTKRVRYSVGASAYEICGNYSCYSF